MSVRDRYARPAKEMHAADARAKAVRESVQFHTAFDTYVLCSRSTNRMLPGTFANEVVNGFKREEADEAASRRGRVHVSRLSPSQIAGDAWESQ